MAADLSKLRTLVEEWRQAAAHKEIETKIYDQCSDALEEALDEQPKQEQREDIVP